MADDTVVLDPIESDPTGEPSEVVFGETPVEDVEEVEIESPPEVESDKTQFIYDDNGAPIYNGESFVRDPEEAEAILAQRAKDVENASALSKVETNYQADLDRLNAKYAEKRASILNG